MIIAQVKREVFMHIVACLSSGLASQEQKSSASISALTGL